MSRLPWKDGQVVEWTQWMLDSHCHWTGRELIDRSGGPETQARRLFEFPRIVVSHGKEEDPILNYANQAALSLWDFSWERMKTMPSRFTAEPVEQAERDRMLSLARERGYFDRYRGVRITSSGRRFIVDDACIWTIRDCNGQTVGQAATFEKWKWMS
ncbi:MEKHLA domain-containing protein [Nitrospira sp. KM1]|uniref:MEKHLA domain-containing protein n=1 Tax=Nitrospira sp. KM1 TaxID=1936990 RepID=UPI0013A730EA|nr:MEKHLA domain-containing protein [Nitrospira sp. KM1]BCA55194.1 MEKHLA domain-containing protein [Nitrospira sp. KM1]